MNKFEEKLHSIKSNYNRKCSCGHSVSTLPIHIYKKNYVVCTWCGKKVFKDIEKQVEQDEKIKREEFRFKLQQAMSKTNTKRKRSTHER